MLRNNQPCYHSTLHSRVAAPRWLPSLNIIHRQSFQRYSQLSYLQSKGGSRIIDERREWKTCDEEGNWSVLYLRRLNCTRKKRWLSSRTRGLAAVAFLPISSIPRRRRGACRRPIYAHSTCTVSLGRSADTYGGRNYAAERETTIAQ